MEPSPQMSPTSLRVLGADTGEDSSDSESEDILYFSTSGRLLAMKMCTECGRRAEVAAAMVLEHT